MQTQNIQSSKAFIAGTSMPFIVSAMNIWILYLIKVIVLKILHIVVVIQNDH